MLVRRSRTVKPEFNGKNVTLKGILKLGLTVSSNPFFYMGKYYGQPTVLVARNNYTRFATKPPTADFGEISKIVVNRVS